MVSLKKHSPTLHHSRMYVPTRVSNIDIFAIGPLIAKVSCYQTKTGVRYGVMIGLSWERISSLSKI